MNTLFHRDIITMDPLPLPTAAQSRSFCLTNDIIKLDPYQ